VRLEAQVAQNNFYSVRLFLPLIWVSISGNKKPLSVLPKGAKGSKSD
jgi:hypothetical protein